MSIAENATLTVTDRLGRRGFVCPRRQGASPRRMIADLAIKTPGPDQPVSGLSGGNQQKVVMARALANDPACWSLITPTAGVDVKSKDSLLGSRSTGAPTRAPRRVIVSDELDDLRVCDRVLAMFHGRVVASSAAAGTTEDSSPPWKAWGTGPRPARSVYRLTGGRPDVAPPKSSPSPREHG